MKGAFPISLLILLLSEATWGFSCSSVSSDTLFCQLNATGDVWLESSTRNYNNFDFLTVGLHPFFPLKRSLVKFEDIPPVCHQVLAGTMLVHYWYAHRTSESIQFIPRPIEARQVLRSWTENQATSTLRFSSTPWSVPYLGLNDDDASSKVDDTQTIDESTIRSYISWNITSTVKNWHAGQPNHGLLLRASNEDQQGRDIRFFSREGRSNQVPYLDVLCSRTTGDDTGQITSTVTTLSSTILPSTSPMNNTTTLATKSANFSVNTFTTKRTAKDSHTSRKSDLILIAAVTGCGSFLVIIFLTASLVLAILIAKKHKKRRISNTDYRPYEEVKDLHQTSLNVILKGNPSYAAGKKIQDTRAVDGLIYAKIEEEIDFTPNNAYQTVLLKQGK